MPNSLKKRDRDGLLYKRPPEIEEKLAFLEVQDPQNRILLFEKSSKSDPDHVPYEVLIYFLRASWREGKKDEFKQIFDILFARIESTLKSIINDGTMENASEIRKEIQGEFAVRIARDCQTQAGTLDFYEIRFNKAFAALRISTLRKIGPKTNQSVPLTLEEGESAEISPEVEAAAQDFFDNNQSKLDDAAFRFSLMTAIDKLPKDQKQVVGLLLQDLPIDSKNPETMTIARILGCNERTVRNRRDRAFKTLRDELQEEWGK